MADRQAGVRGRRWGRFLLVSLGVLVVLVIGAAAATIITFDPNAYKPRIAALVKQATGRDLALKGPITLAWSLRPTIVANDVALSNPPDFSRPNLAHMQRAEVRLALLPLLSGRVEVDRLLLVQPDILLETDAKGLPNWRFQPDSAPPAGPAATPSAHAEDGGRQVFIQHTQITDGTLGYRDARSGRMRLLVLHSLTAATETPSAPLRLDADAEYGGSHVVLATVIKGLNRLWDGTTALPEQPLQMAGSVKLNEQTIDLSATLGTLGGLLRPGSVPLPVDLELRAADASVKAQGQIAHVATFSGVAIDLAGTVPDLSQLGPLLQRRLPALKAVSFKGRVSDAKGGGFAGGVDLQGFSTKSANGDLSGTIAVRSGDPMVVNATLHSDRLDLTGLSFSTAPSPPGSPPGALPSGQKPQTPKSRGSRLFSDEPLNLPKLQGTQADVHFDIGVLHVEPMDIRSVQAHATLRNGALTIDQLTADLAEGHLDATLAVDTRPAPPAFALTTTAPGLALRPLLTAFGQPPFVTGKLEIYANLHGAGETPHAVAGSMDGALGLAVADGTIDNRLLNSVLGTFADKANLGPVLGHGGTSELKCMAVRLDAKQGAATFRALTLSSGLLTATGGGGLNLGNETLALTLLPQGRIGGNSFVVPLRVSGSIRAPIVAPDSGAMAAGVLEGTIAGNTKPLNLLGEILGGQKSQTAPRDTCPQALAIARGQKVPDAPAASSASPPISAQPGTLPVNPGALLQQLFR